MEGVPEECDEVYEGKNECPCCNVDTEYRVLSFDEIVEQEVLCV